jgi:hypothetical protein
MGDPTAEAIFAWADKFSEHTYRLHRMRELRADINKIGTVCGGCNSWMTRACPRERNVNGMNHGPSCESLVGSCPIFTLKSWYAKRKDELTEELKTLEASHG